MKKNSIDRLTAPELREQARWYRTRGRMGEPADKINAAAVYECEALAEFLEKRPEYTTYEQYSKRLKQ
jgi:hypothetical protein